MTDRRAKLLIAVFAFAAFSYFGWVAGASSLRGIPASYGELPAFSATAVDAERAGEFESAELSGKLWIANFVFTRCGGPCPVLSRAMAKLQDRLPGEVELVSFTVDPDRDGVHELSLYAKRHGARAGQWRFLRMPKKDLFELVYAGFRLSMADAPEAPSHGRVIHTTKFVLVDGKGVIRGYYDGGSERSLKAIARDVRRILGSATEENRV